MTFDDAFERLLMYEGGYSNHSADPGGKTKYGITEKVAREHGYLGEMQHLTLSFAKRIYRSAYWEKCFAEEMPAPLRYPLFDGAVNSGVGQSVRWLQRALQVADDGKIGPVTLKAVWACEPQQVLRSMLGQRLLFMTDLNTWQHFGKGWARRIAKEMMA